MNIKETACLLSLLSHNSVQTSQTGVYTAHGISVKCHRVGNAYGQGVRDGRKRGGYRHVTEQGWREYKSEYSCG